TPVLTKELLYLGNWLAEKTLALQITTFQAMLPQLLKSTYKKELVKQTETLPDSLEALFNDRDRIDYEALEQSPGHYQQLQEAIESGQVKVNYVVESRITKKYNTIIKPAASVTEFQSTLNDLPQHATRQRQIISFFIENYEPINQSKLYALLEITRTHLNPLLNKDLITIEKQEVYRNPYERKFKKTTHL